MKKILTLLSGTALYVSSFSQVNFNGSSSPVSTGTSAATVVVDNSITISAPTAIDGATVSITTNFFSGDVLSYNNALLPAGVSATYNSANGVLTFKGNATVADYQALLRSVTFRANAAGVGDRTVLFNLGTAFFNPATNHFYQYVPGSLTWTAAQANAATKSYYGLTGYLATITSLSENQFIQQKLATSGWIGASDDYTVINTATGGATYANQAAAEGRFHWVTGPEAGTLFSTGNGSAFAAPGQFANWNSGEPNNWAGSEHYTAMYTNGAWNDGSNAGDASTSGYFIEYGGLAADPAADLVHSRVITVANTSMSATESNNYYALNNSVIVDNAVTVASGGMITNARVTISGNFSAGDQLSFLPAALPAGVTGSYNSSTGVLSFTGTASPGDWQALFRTVRFQSTSSSTSDRDVSFSVGNLISGSNGHFYEFIQSATGWPSARAAAEAKSYMGLQGYLATVTSQAENDLIWQKLSADGWLGGSDEYNLINAASGSTLYADQAVAEGKFYWVTGPEKGQLISTGNHPSTTASSYANWYNGEPNNYANNEHYIEIYSSSSQPGTWNDFPANNNIGYVVEYGGLPTDPGVVLSVSRTLSISVVVPVRNLQFTLERKNGNVILSWKSDEEKDVDRYEIWHSAPGTMFTKIGEVAAATKERSGYTFTDTRTLSGKHLYRLVIIDKDGQKTYSGIRAALFESNLSLHPTMVRDHFTISQSGAAHLTVSVFNTAGRLVHQKTTDARDTLVDASSLQSGVYVVVVTDQSKQVKVFRIIKG